MQGVQGWPAQVCHACGSVTLEAQAARQILGTDAIPRSGQSEVGWRSSSDPLMSDARIALHLENLRAERQRRLTIAIGLATSAVVVVLALPLSIVVYDTVRDRVAARNQAAPPALEEAIAPPAPAVVALPSPSPALVAQEVEPEPAPDPAPTTAGSFRKLVREGWALVDRRSYAPAAERFRTALEQRPGDPEASYGVGYALLQQGDKAGAKRHLCTALAGGDNELRREVRSLLEHNQLSCP